MFKNGQYNIDFLLNGAGNLDSDKLNNYAKVLGIPIMLRLLGLRLFLTGLFILPLTYLLITT